MSEFVKKTAFGNYKQVNGGQSDPECTHVIMTVKEYEQLLKAKKDAETERSNALFHRERELREMKSEAETRVSEVKRLADQEIDNIKAKLTEAQEEAMFQASLNRNLLRISKERANADRGLRPKKEHTGYFVVSSMEKEYRYKDRYHGGIQVKKLWETTIQSPYSVDFSEAEVRKQIQELTVGREDGAWMIGKIGISGAYEGKYEEMIGASGWKEHENYNVMLNQRLRANYGAGYWELLFLHTKPLDVVPEDMRARNKKNHPVNCVNLPKQSYR